MPTVKLPNGKTARFPDSMQPDEIQKAIESDPEFAPQPGVPAAPVPKGLTGPSESNIAGNLLNIGKAYKDTGAGLLKGAGSTANNIGHLLYPDALAKHLTGAPSAEQQESYFKPANTQQRVAKGVEQAAEFMIPGAAEEEGAAGLAKLAPKAGKFVPKLLTSAAGSGLINKAQGGDFSTGAAAGAAGAGIGAGMKAAAPTLTGIAQGLEAPYGKTGTAILKETKGLLPGSIRNSARGVLDKLNPELNQLAENSSAQVPMQSARDAANEQIGRAAGQNNPKMTKGVTRMGKQLFEQEHTPALGAQGPSGTIPIPDQVPASQYLELKRGVGKALPAGSWNPESSNAFKGPRNAIYGAMGNEFEKAVPEAAPLNQRISSLIPATEKPKSALFGHALGPGVGAILGGSAGYRKGGLPEAATGAIEGATAGFAAPTLMNAGARAAFSPAGQRLLPAATGGLLQLTRKDQQQ